MRPDCRSAQICHSRVSPVRAFPRYARRGRRVDLAPHPWVGKRARVNLRTRVRRFELDLSFAAPDAGDAHSDLVAEAVSATPSAAHQRRRELVQLEVVAGKAAGGDVALEDVAEADEDPGRDHAGDLALERRLPAQLEQALLEQPRETELVRAVLDPRGVAFALRRMRGVLLEVVGQGLVGHAELAQQGAVHHEVGIAADRRGEVAVGPAREPRVAEVPRVVARLLERLEHERWVRLAPATGLFGVV